MSDLPLDIITMKGIKITKVNQENPHEWFYYIMYLQVDHPIFLQSVQRGQ